MAEKCAPRGDLHTYSCTAHTVEEAGGGERDASGSFTVTHEVVWRGITRGGTSVPYDAKVKAQNREGAIGTSAKRRQTPNPCARKAEPEEAASCDGPMEAVKTAGGALAYVLASETATDLGSAQTHVPERRSVVSLDRWGMFSLRATTFLNARGFTLTP